jgi:hypothetical protein
MDAFIKSPIVQIFLIITTVLAFLYAVIIVCIQMRSEAKEKLRELFNMLFHSYLGSMEARRMISILVPVMVLTQLGLTVSVVEKSTLNDAFISAGILQQVLFLSLILITFFMGIIFCAITLKEIIMKRTYHFRDYAKFLILLLVLIHLFTIGYMIIYRFDDRSFIGINNENGNIYLDFLYFSVVTFTTLGYGDIYPVSVLARGVVMIEVLLFVVYISIILLSMNRRSKDQNKE